MTFPSSFGFMSVRKNAKKLADLSQAQHQIAIFRDWSCPGLARDPRSDAVGGFIDLRKRRSPQMPVHQCGGEGIPSAHGIRNFDVESGMLRIFGTGQQQAAVSAASDADQIQVIRREQAARRSMLVAIFQLKQGEVSEPVRQPNGFYLFRAEEITYRPLQQVRDEIFTALQQQHGSEWMAQIDRATKVDYPTPGFTAAKPPAAPPSLAAPAKP